MLVTCTYVGTEETTLEGPDEDFEDMKSLFEDLNYYVIPLKNENAKKEEIIKTLEQLSGYLTGYDGPQENKVLIFAFSGHGSRDDHGNFLETHDLEKIYLPYDILPHYVDHPSAFKIPKLFFINACRGEQRLAVKVTMQRRVFRAPNYAVGNYLIAYATIDRHVAYDKWWMKKLVQTIRDQRRANSLSTILDNVARLIQEDLQPEYVSRLRGSFMF